MKSTTLGSLVAVVLSFVASSNAAHVRYCEDEDFGGYCNGLDGPACFNLDFMSNKITSYSVTGGTCWFYDGPNCEGRLLFSAKNREHGELPDGDNDRISSIRWSPYNPDKDFC